MTVPLLPNSQAWIAKDATLIRQYTVQLTGGGSRFSSLDQEHWVVVVDAAGIISRIGRILRVRRDLEWTQVYFDRLHIAQNTGQVIDLGLKLPDGPLARLRPEDFDSILAREGISSTADLPLIKDALYVRELLELATRDDLLGPANGPEEFVIDMSVRDRYLVGKLAPRKLGDANADINNEPEAASDEVEESAEEYAAPLHEPGAEFNRASGRVEPEDDALDEIDTTNNQSLVPSSMGLTFCVGPDVGEISVTARWGRYDRVPSEEHEFTKLRKNRKTGDQEEVKVKVWRRVPCGGIKSLPVKDGQVRPFAPDSREPDVRMQGTVRTNANGERLVTLFLVNGQMEPETNKDRAWLFQPEIIVRSSLHGEEAVFRRRPSSDVVVDDSERDHLGLIYRRRVEFAVGHGVAVHAETALTDSMRAVEIRTQVIPRLEVPVTETPGLDPTDRPAMRMMVERGWLDMTTLAGMEAAELQKALSTLVDDYESWIIDQRARVGTEIVGFDDAANAALDRCETILKRLRTGVEVLLNDSNALAAFKFTNRAMALQRVHSIFALRRRRNEEVEFEDLDEPRNRSWRPFQLAFLLLSIPSLADPKHVDRTSALTAWKTSFCIRTWCGHHVW